MTMPNFMLIGAAKSGTTALWHFLNQHPEIFMCHPKEPNFFALEGHPIDFQGPGDPYIKRTSINNLAAYQRLFDGVRGEKAIGDASVLYIYHPRAPERIKHYVPDAKIIALLRNPVERAYSTYCFLIEQGRETIERFSTALEIEETRMQQNWEHIWHYRHLGYYHQQLSRYYAQFDPRQIRVYLYDDYRRDNRAIVQDIYRFLGVDASFSPTITTDHRVSGIPKSKALHNLLVRPNLLKRLIRPFFSQQMRHKIHVTLRRRNLEKRPMPEDMRAMLRDEYRDDILKLQDLIQRDLSAWLKA